MSGLIKQVARATYKTPWAFSIRFNQTSSGTCQTVPDVPGLSKKVVNVPECEEVGPGASKEGIYKNPEYYCYDQVSYFEAEIELSKFRLPQPSNKA